MDHNEVLSFLTELTPLEKEFRKCRQQGRALSAEECTRLVTRINATCPNPIEQFFSIPDDLYRPLDPKILEMPLQSDEYYFPDGAKIGVGVHQRYAPGFIRANSFIEIAYVLSGSCTEEIVFSPDHVENLTLTQGQVCILPPHLKHAAHVYNDSCLLVTINIRASVMKETISNIVVEDHALYDFFLYTLYENEHSSYLLFSTGSDETIRNLVLDMFVEFNIQKSYSQNALTLMLGLFFTYLQRDYSDDLIFSNTSVSGITYIPKILNYIRQNFATATVKSIAEHFSVSTSWLDRIFRNNSNSTVTETIQEMRMEHACHLLSTTNLPVQMVAEAVGYSDVTHFIRLFKKYETVTPLQYRKKMA